MRSKDELALRKHVHKHNNIRLVASYLPADVKRRFMVILCRMILPRSPSTDLTSIAHLALSHIFRPRLLFPAEVPKSYLVKARSLLSFTFFLKFHSRHRYLRENNSRSFMVELDSLRTSITIFRRLSPACINVESSSLSSSISRSIARARLPISELSSWSSAGAPLATRKKSLYSRCASCAVAIKSPTLIQATRLNLATQNYVSLEANDIILPSDIIVKDTARTQCTLPHAFAQIYIYLPRSTFV